MAGSKIVASASAGLMQSKPVRENRLKQPAVFGRARARCLAFASIQTYNKAPTTVGAGVNQAGLSRINPLY